MLLLHKIQIIDPTPIMQKHYFNFNIGTLTTLKMEFYFKVPFYSCKRKQNKRGIKTLVCCTSININNNTEQELGEFNMNTIK